MLVGLGLEREGGARAQEDAWVGCLGWEGKERWKMSWVHGAAESWGQLGTCRRAS